MPVSADSRYVTISAVLTKDQARRLESLRLLRSTSMREASKSEILREVIDAGLRVYSHAPDSGFATTTMEDAERVA